jgi:hypothetical protein
VRLAVLGAPRWNRESAPVEVDFRPAHVAHLGAPAPGENQQLDNLAESVIAASAPDAGQLFVGQHALARLALGRFGGTNGRVVLDQPHLHSPDEETGQGPARSRGCRAATLAHDGHWRRCPAA